MIRNAILTDIEKVLQITKACAVKMANAKIYQWDEHYPNEKLF